MSTPSNEGHLDCSKNANADTPIWLWGPDLLENTSTDKTQKDPSTLTLSRYE